MALIMQRLWSRVVLPLPFALLALLYFGDWLVLLLRPSAGPNTVQVDQFLKTPLKGQKEEYDYLGTVAQPCVASLFPHRAQNPCWWLARHKTQWISP